MQVPLGQPDAAEIEADAFPRGDQLGRAAADVEHEGLVADCASVRDTAPRQLRFFLAGEQPRREAVAPLDLAQERFAILGVANGARPDREHALGAEPLCLAAVLGEHVPHPRDRQRQQLAALVDALAEPRDLRVARDFLDASVVHVGDEQTGRVGAQVDGCDAHVPRLAVRSNAGPRRPGSNLDSSTAKGAGDRVFVVLATFDSLDRMTSEA